MIATGKTRVEAPAQETNDREILEIQGKPSSTHSNSMNIIFGSEHGSSLAFLLRQYRHPSRSAQLNSA